MNGAVVPGWIVGAWERASLEIAGRQVEAIGRAVWLQTARSYVDVRAPGEIASGTCFAGRGAWDGHTFTWHHELDQHPRPGSVDRGTLDLVDGELIERGEGIDGGQSRYVERWRRMPDSEGPVAIVTTTGGLAVHVGGHRALVCARRDGDGMVGARYSVRVGDVWVDELVIGDPDWHPFRRDG